MPSGANGLPLAAAAPTLNTRKKVPIASTAYLTTARGAAAALQASSPVNTRLASCAVTMTPRLVAQVTHVVSAVTQLRLPTALLPDYLPASITPINVAPVDSKTVRQQRNPGRQEDNVASPRAGELDVNISAARETLFSVLRQHPYSLQGALNRCRIDIVKGVQPGQITP